MHQGKQSNMVANLLFRSLNFGFTLSSTLYLIQVRFKTSLKLKLVGYQIKK